MERDTMTQDELETMIRDLCDKSGLRNDELIDVLDPIVTGLKMIEAEDAEE
jgi:hypothetical protein